ncbi:MAG: hypothetical protein ACE5IZ_01090 [Dehalococcoidia bacterium]
MDDYGLDLEDVRRVIATAEVLVVRFAILEKRLLLDTRQNDSEGPLIRLVPRVGSVEERFRHLKQMRPRFPLPEKIMSFMWPRQVETFRASGLWQCIVDRLAQSNVPGMLEQCETVYQELLQEERKEVLGAIRGGEGYQSLWERGG